MSQRIKIDIIATCIDERYLGEKTGFKQWQVYTRGSGILGAVLGRGPTKNDALNDWRARARADGYPVQMYDLVEK